MVKNQIMSNMNVEQNEAILEDDETLSALKERWFKLAKQENFPKTKDISKKLDDLEKSINARKEEILNV